MYGRLMTSIRGSSHNLPRLASVAFECGLSSTATITLFVASGLNGCTIDVLVMMTVEANELLTNGGDKGGATIGKVV